MKDRDNLLAAVQDLFGYSADDFNGQSFQEILDYLTADQRSQVNAYLVDAQAGLETAKNIYTA